MALKETIQRKIGPETESRLFTLTSWGAIFAGAFVALVVEATLTLLGYAVGAFQPVTAQAPLGAVSVGIEIWLIVSTFISFFIGGWVAGRLSGYANTRIGAMHGIVSWCLASVFGLAMLGAPLGNLINGMNGIVGKGMLLLQTGIVDAGLRGTIMGMTTSAAIAAFIAMVLNFIAASAGGSAGATMIKYTTPEEVREEEKREFPKAA